MPKLNPTKCYEQQKQSLAITLTTPLPEQWLTEFYTLLSEYVNFDDKTNLNKELFYIELDKHVGTHSTYTLSEKLKESLATLYTLFKHQKTTEEQKKYIASRIAEDVSQCSPGFTNRVNYVISHFNMPKSMDELIAQVRFNLVDGIASMIAAKAPEGIHLHNRVFQVAINAGFGVWPINTDDLYLSTGSDDLSDESIIKMVQKGFDRHFQLFSLVNALREQIESLIALCGYQGKRVSDNEYKFGEYAPFIKCIKRFIPIETQSLFEMDELSHKITDINWGYVKHALLQKLKKENYLILSKEEAALLDGDEQNLTLLIPDGYELAQCLEFYSNWRIEQKEALVLEYLKSKSREEQKELLAILHNESPQLTAQLKKETKLQAIYFDIAITEEDVNAVRTYIEDGANIKEALPLLFDEAHKRDTLYWLYEHPYLLQKITVEGLHTVISQGKYQGKTIAETLVSTKKGRQLLLENELLQTLLAQTTLANRLNDYLQHAEAEKRTMNTQQGFFKKPSALTTLLVQTIVYGDLKESQALLEGNSLLLETLLTEKVTVIDYSRRKIKQKTAFQAALCAMDEELYAMLAKYMTKEEMARQYQEIFPEGHETYYQQQTPFDFSQIVEAISNGRDEDIEKALSLELPNNTGLWRQLEQFRVNFTKRSSQEAVFNPKHFLEAFKLYNSQFDSWSSIKRHLFWRQIIGYVQRFLPANIDMYFNKGPYIEYKRSINVRNASDSNFPLTNDALSGLGYEDGPWKCNACPSNTAHLATIGFSKLISSNNSSLKRVIQPESCHDHTYRCLIL